MFTSKAKYIRCSPHRGRGSCRLVIYPSHNSSGPRDLSWGVRQDRARVIPSDSLPKGIIPADQLEGQNATEQNRGTNTTVLGFLAGFALVIAIGASAIAAWTMNQSQTRIDALTVELGATQENLNASMQTVNAAAADRIADIDKAAAKAAAEMNKTIDRAVADVQALATAASSTDLASIERDLGVATGVAQEAYGIAQDAYVLAQDAIDRTDDITACVNDYMDTIGRWSANINSYFTWFYC